MKTKIDKARVATIRDAVRPLKKGEALIVQTTLNARQLTPRLQTVQDEDGFHKAYECKTVPGGVCVTCVWMAKISAITFDGVTS